MASLKELQDGLVAADAAGNSADAQVFADEIRKMQEAPAPEQEPQRSHGSAATLWDNDPTMAIGQGLARSVIATPGMLSSVREFLGTLEPKSDADRWVAKNVLPTLSKTLKGIPGVNQALYGPTSQELLDAVDKVVPVNKEYKGLSGYLERGAESYLPGPGGKAQATRDVLAALAAGVGGKGASDLAEAFHVGPRGQSVADFLGSLAGVVVGKGKGANEVKIAAKGAPTREALGTAAENAYETLKPIQVDPYLFSNALNKIDKAFGPAGVKPRHIPDIYGDLADLERKNSLNMADIMSTRAEANTAKRYNPSNPHISKAADIVVDKLDEYINTASPSNPRLGREYKKAREIGRSQAKSSDFDTALQRGEVSQMGETIGGMNEARALAKRDTKTLSPLEKRGVKNIVGRNARNPIRILGRGFQGFLTQGVGAGTSAYMGNLKPLAIAIALGAAGKGMEKFADVMSNKKLQDLIASMRAGRPAQERATRRAARINQDRSTAQNRGILGSLKANTFINTGQE